MYVTARSGSLMCDIPRVVTESQLWVIRGALGTHRSSSECRMSWCGGTIWIEISEANKQNTIVAQSYAMLTQMWCVCHCAEDVPKHQSSALPVSNKSDRLPLQRLPASKLRLNFWAFLSIILRIWWNMGAGRTNLNCRLPLASQFYSTPGAAEFSWELQNSYHFVQKISCLLSQTL